jgi:hypothetical protein
VNAAAQQLGTTWPSLRKAFARHGLGMPARNPEAVRQRAIAAARQRAGRPATPALDPVLVALNPRALPARERPAAELYAWVRRDEEYAILGANVVVELNSESRSRRPTSRAWAIIRRADRAHRRHQDREQRGERREAGRASRPDRSHQPQERERAEHLRRTCGWSVPEPPTPAEPWLALGPDDQEHDEPPDRSRRWLSEERDSDREDR